MSSLNMTKCLFLLSLCLLPFVAFSSTFTSENPIDLPTATSAKLVVDRNGKALDPRASYRIVSIFRGALGGDVYLGASPKSTSHFNCLDGVFRYNSDVGPSGTPVEFIKSDHTGPGIFENQDINIKFLTATTRLCVNYTTWKVGDYDVSLGARLLQTGGTTGQQDSSWFKIVKTQGAWGYHLLYCPGPLVCPSCPVDQCQTVGQVIQNRKKRLALVKDQRLRVLFQKV
ncbi:serine protease inhibitor 5-like [Lycium ferocissimum]|uniref:serine protease inhibitor 5-like n=1 Tax=Lycium ferocissimum TaxID=112874 RepID=UPI00281498BE|nr:serine protease inhibitor 5-like [Lycium ferocissimum]